MSLFNRYARFLGAVRDEFTFVSWRSAERSFEEAQIDALPDVHPSAFVDTASFPEAACTPTDR